ncbi:AAA family ATPase [Prochlorococcus marinus]|uniref:AAA family ATPase n=1 Tax=Prochlorococcus marinus TaxID=1219 RepID=UPI0022B410F8|nr:AAA family ATPase [Prochlorococcus marinus]
MRLINCRIQNVRIHADLSIDFSPRITLIGGANETGKSTLIESLHRTLFLKATSTGAPIEALKSKLYLGHPTVQIKFEAIGKVYLLRKRFTGHSGQITLLNETNGEQVSGTNAEELLAELIGVKESLGSRQANSLLASRWAHLWVMQGSALNNLLNKDKSSYDFDSLVSQLEKKGGATIQQSIHDQKVVKEIEKKVDQTFTSRGIKKNSALWECKKQLRNSEELLASARSNIKEYEKASEELIAINEKLAQINNNHLPNLLQKKSILSEKVRACENIKADINLTEKESEPIRFKYNTLNKVIININFLEKAIKGKELKIESLQAEHNTLHEKENKLKNELKKLKGNHRKLKMDLLEIDRKRQLIQLLIDQFLNEEIIYRLNKQLKEQRVLFEKRKALEEELDLLPKINHTDLKKIKDLHQKLRDIITRKSTLASSIKVIKSNQKILINDDELKIGTKKHMNEKFELKIGKEIFLEIQPGGGINQDNLENEYFEAEKSYSDCLSKFQLKSLEIAENNFIKKSSIEQQLENINYSSQQEIITTEKEINAYKLKAIEIKKGISSLNIHLKELGVNENFIANDMNELKKIQQKTEASFTHTTTSFRHVEENLETTDLKVNDFIVSKVKAQSNLEIIKSEVKSSQRNLDLLQKENGDSPRLINQCLAIKAQLQASEKNLGKLRKKLESLIDYDYAAELLNIENKIESITKQREDLIAERGSAQRNCLEISSQNPYEALEKAKVQIETAKAEYTSLKLITESHKLLQTLFTTAQSDLSNRYTTPLAKSIGLYLRPLSNDREIAKLAFDQIDGFSGIQLRRGNNFYNFDQLSGGMKEQLTAALRLSMADVLKEKYNGCLPLVFDDAFTNSDPRRIELVKKMLETAITNGLQIILLTCNPNDYLSFANKTILLEKVNQNKESQMK